ncbi:type IX secretion system plug protein domain-containing protein, partial [Vibrio parahaemolyticus]
SGDQLELHFDDLAAIPANYYYTYQLCNADWSEAQWSPFDYIRGFQQNRINTYRVASITRIPYVHYQALLPERNAMPSRSGNYLLKVYK